MHGPEWLIALFKCFPTTLEPCDIYLPHFSPELLSFETSRWCSLEGNMQDSWAALTVAVKLMWAAVRIFPCGWWLRQPKDLLHVVLGFWHCLFKNPWPWTPSAYSAETHSRVLWAMFRLLWKLLDESFFNDNRECAGMNLKRTATPHWPPHNQDFLFRLE